MLQFVRLYRKHFTVLLTVLLLVLPILVSCNTNLPNILPTPAPIRKNFYIHPNLEPRSPATATHVILLPPRHNVTPGGTITPTYQFTATPTRTPMLSTTMELPTALTPTPTQTLTPTPTLTVAQTLTPTQTPTPTPTPLAGGGYNYQKTEMIPQPICTGEAQPEFALNFKNQVSSAKIIRDMKTVSAWELSFRNLPPPPDTMMNIVPPISNFPLNGLGEFHNPDSLSYNVQAILNTRDVELPKKSFDTCGMMAMLRAAREDGLVLTLHENKPPLFDQNIPWNGWYWTPNVLGFRSAFWLFYRDVPGIVQDTRLTESKDMIIMARDLGLQLVSNTEAYHVLCPSFNGLNKDYPDSPANVLCLAANAHKAGYHLFALASWNPIIGIAPRSYNTSELPARYRRIVTHWVEIYSVEQITDPYGKKTWLVRYYDPALNAEVLQWYVDVLRGWGEHDFTFLVFQSSYQTCANTN